MPNIPAINGWNSKITVHDLIGDPGSGSEPVRLELIRNLVPGEFGYYGERMMMTGETVFRYVGVTSHITPLPTGVFVSDFGERKAPFFEVPLDAVKVAENESQKS